MKPTYRTTATVHGDINSKVGQKPAPFLDVFKFLWALQKCLQASATPGAWFGLE